MPGFPPTADLLGLLDLPHEVRDSYRRISLGQPVDPDSPALQHLLQMGLVVPDADDPSTFTMVDPGQVYDQLRDRGLEKLAENTRFLRKLPQLRRDLQDLLDDFRASSSDPGRGSVAGVVEYLEDMDLINSRLDKIVSGARWELLTAQPDGPRTPAKLQRSLERDRAAIARGVSMRTLYHSSARSGAETREWARQMTSIGAQVRILDKPFLRVIMVDRRHAMIEDFMADLPEAQKLQRALLIHDPGMCAWIAQVFDRDFSRADFWYGGRSLDEGPVTTQLQRSILRDLCAGRHQKQIAKRLGVSERTINQRLQELRTALGLDTLYQLIAWWMTSEERDLDD